MPLLQQPTQPSISYVLRKSSWVGSFTIEDEIMDDTMGDINPYVGDFDIEDEIMDDVMEDDFDVVDDLALLFANVSIKADPVDELASLFAQISM